MTPRIGIDYTAAVHEPAGTGRYTREMVQALATLPDDMPQFDYRLFVADAGQVAKSALPGANFAWCPSRMTFPWSSSRLTERRLAGLWYRIRLPLWVEGWTGRLDLFHATDFLLPPVMPGTRTVVTIHDLSFVREPDTALPAMKAHLTKWVPDALRRADHIIAVSEATRRDLMELYQTPPEKTTVLYHGVGPEFRPVTDSSRLAGVRQKYRLGERPFILSLGTIQPRKNYQRLIQAFAQMDSSVELVIVGRKGWLYDAILDEVTRQNLAERVRFIGFVAEADLPALYSAATLFAYPSLYEGFGMPVLEAMACGTPVIASNQSAVPEVIGEAGLLVNPRDVTAIASAMSRLLSEPTLREQSSHAGRAQAAKFTWTAMATDLLSLYQMLLRK
ncbi:MAG: glycosyltransferase family 4 protein [Candidatus Binatia bacterium]